MMKFEFNTKGMLVSGLLLSVLFSQGAAAAGDNPNADVQQFRKDCMESLGNKPFCACMANVLKTHVPKEHLSHNADGEIEFHEDMSPEAHHKTTKGAAECQEKFPPNE